MANWCEGTLKIRGTKKDMLNFIKNGIQPTNGSSVDVHEYDDYFVVNILGEPWVTDSERAFINTCDAFAYDDYDIMVFDVEQAWGFRIEDWQNISKEYHIDIRLYGFERGMEFNQETEIIDGNVTLDNYIHFNDYRWECPMPNMGG